MTNPEDKVMNGSLTLRQRLVTGALPLPEALRYAMMLGEELRQIHDSGLVYGALAPSNVTVTASGLELITAPEQPTATTPYTAPEILQGHTADARSDIFAFGGIVYEMVTGRRAFAGDNPDALAVSLTISDPPATGIPAIDHLVSNCIAKDPTVRCPRMQKVILELKVLTFAAPRTEVVTQRQNLTAAVRAETQQLEDRVAGLLQTHEKAIDVIQQTSGDAISELRERLARVESQLAPVQARSTMLEALCQRILGHVDQIRQNFETLDERANGMKEGIDVLGQGATMLHDYVSARMHEFEQSLKSQRTAIAAVSASQSQTDDLVEGLVGAVDLLHAVVIEPTDDFGSVNARPRGEGPGPDGREEPDGREADLELSAV
jgi:predicted  nucleic acid-binding Zn-ribbon protein